MRRILKVGPENMRLPTELRPNRLDLNQIPYQRRPRRLHPALVDLLWRSTSSRRAKDPAPMCL